MVGNMAINMQALTIWPTGTNYDTTQQIDTLGLRCLISSLLVYIAISLYVPLIF